MNKPATVTWEVVALIECDSCELGSKRHSVVEEIKLLREMGFAEEADALHYGWLP